MKKIIGKNALISVMEFQNIPAKIDTGADSSAIWVSDLNVSEDGVLTFKLFGKKSPFYNGKIIQKSKDSYKVVITRSSHGDRKAYYRTTLPAIIKGQKINILFTLSNRAAHQFPILIGRRTLENRFIVDVAKSEVKNIPLKLPKPKSKSQKLNQELQKNPYQFHQKYIKNPKEPL